MRSQSNKYVIYIVLAILIFGIVYTACMDITPSQTSVEQNIELKLGK